MTVKVEAPLKGRLLTRWLFVALVVVTTATFFMPFKPGLPKLSLDSSWTFAINQAVNQHLVFGKDFIFTFGPFGFVFTRAFTPGQAPMIYAACAYVTAAYAVALLMLVRGHARRWTVGLLLVLSLIHWSIDGLLYSYPFFVALVCCEGVGRKAGLTGRRAFDLALIAFLFSVIGLLPLVKGTLVIFCVLIVAMTGLYLLANRRFEWMATAVGASIVSLVGFWLIGGQPIAALPGYFTAMSQIISGYTDAMSVQGNNVEALMYIAAALFIAASLYFSDRRLTSRNLFILALFGLFLFMSFKASFVRHDPHVVVAMTTLVIAVFTLQFVDKARYFWTAGAFSTLAIAAMYVGAFNMLEPDSALFANYAHMVGSLGHSPAADYAAAQARVRREEPLRTLPGASDIYSYDQNQLFASANRWAPRPVAQSYSAYTPKLAMLDAQHLMSPSAPDNIFLSLEPIDGRMPSMEDGPSLAVMLMNDRPAGVDGRFLVLKRNPTLKVWAPETAGPAQTAALGEVLTLPTLPTLPAPVFAQFRFKRSLTGKLEEILFKPSQLNLTVTLTTGEQKVYRFVPDLAAAGFIISPLIQSVGDFAALYDGASMNWLPQVRSLKIDAADPALRSWAPRYEVRFSPLPVDHAAAVDSSTSIVKTEDCEGHFDSIEVSGAGSSDVLKVRGWVAHAAAPATSLRQLYVILTSASGDRLYFPTGPSQRPDVAAAKNNKDLGDSGFDAAIAAAGLSGKYDVQIGYRQGQGQAVLCRSLEGTVQMPGIQPAAAR